MAHPKTVSCFISRKDFGRSHDGAPLPVHVCRPDEWDAMDYELPIDYPAGQFYWLREDGRVDELPRNGALMRII